MDSHNSRIELKCLNCGATERLDEIQLLQRLQAAGMLRREKEPEWELVEQLLRSRADDFSCPECGGRGMQVDDASRSDDEWGLARNCERCGKAIASERLEVFPDSQLCSTCQQKSDQGDSGDDVEYCSHCGSILKMRQSHRGLARYVLQCPDCGRS